MTAPGPLLAETLYIGYQSVASFAVDRCLPGLALIAAGSSNDLRTAAGRRAGSE
jgi:hypothetical protein